MAPRMNNRRKRSDDLLFLSAVAAILLGTAFLLFTTHTFTGASRAWPLLLMGAGGAFLYLCLVRGAAFSFLFGGLVFTLEGAFILACMLLGWRIARAWPLGMAIAGLAGLASGLAAKRRLQPFFAVPSFGFTALGLGFSVFSFGLVKDNLAGFISVWWPTLLIAGGISLFVAYGLSRRSARREGRGRRRGRRGPRWPCPAARPARCAIPGACRPG